MEHEKKFKEKTLELIDSLNDQMKQLEETLASRRKGNDFSDSKTPVNDKEK